MFVYNIVYYYYKREDEKPVSFSTLSIPDLTALAPVYKQRAERERQRQKRDNYIDKEYPRVSSSSSINIAKFS